MDSPDASGSSARDPSPLGPPPEASEEEREIAALLAGDEAAFLALASRHHAGMLRVASLYVKSRAIAEEAVQEAWIGVLKGLPRFERRASLRSWIFRIVVNCAKRRGEREAFAIPMSSLVDDEGGSEPSVPPERFQGPGERWSGHWAEPPEMWPDSLVESSQMLALVREAMEKLPEKQRTVMTLRDVEGWECGDVCEFLGISEANQRVLLHRARSKVRSHVEARLGREDRR